MMSNPFHFALFSDEILPGRGELSSLGGDGLRRNRSSVRQMRERLRMFGGLAQIQICERGSDKNKAR